MTGIWQDSRGSSALPAVITPPYDSPDAGADSELPATLGTNDKSRYMVLIGVYAILFLFGAVSFVAALKDVLDVLDVNVWLPPWVRSFLSWIASFQRAY